MQYRNYDPEKDKKAVNRIWLECGWIEKDDTKPMDTLLEKARTIVVDVNGEPECLVVSILGDMDYLGERIPFSCIAGVTTSLVARKQRLAARLTAIKIALDVLDGYHVSGLGMFEQGYYDKLGFGSEAYHHYAMFSPAILNVDIEPRVPSRLEIDDFEKIHECRLNRLRMHGSVSIDFPEVTKADMLWSKAGFGLGYFDDNGMLTHHIWLKGKEKGPYEVWWMAYQNFDQFKELLALIRSFGDQILLVKMVEPPGVHLQDFLTQPFRFRALTQKSQFENTMRASAWHQRRICDLEKCLEKTHLPDDEVRFNLNLHDPIEKYLDDDIGWKGISGDYVVTLGPDSNAEKGSDNSLPTLTASVGAFTRMWLGVLPASSLTVSDDLAGPQELIERLDHLVRVPKPEPNWEY